VILKRRDAASSLAVARGRSVPRTRPYDEDGPVTQPPGRKVSELARLACMSEEHRRRLCHEDYQRSPMDHLTHLRLRRAGTMLRSSPEKVEGIAHQAGYASVYCFSAAFRRWSSIPPARFRRV
jgi:transcriptional regulator GlxA family with amidase domain